MESLLFFRAFFQLVNQYVSGFTYLYSFAFFALVVWAAFRGSMRFSRLEIIAYGYFLLSIGVGFAAGASVSTSISTYNKLFLCLLIMKVFDSGFLGLRSTKARRLFQATLYIMAVFVIVSLFTDSAYEDAWGSSTFLMEFSSQHETASFITLLIALIAFDSDLGEASRKLVKFGLATVLVYALLMTGARTITAAGLVLYAFFLYDITASVDRKLRVLLLVVLVVAIAIFVVPQIEGTTFFEKNESASESGNFSNGREDIWAYYLGEFVNFSPIQQVFGAGVGFIAEESDLTVGTHNDFIGFLISYGIVGLALYLLYMFKQFFSQGINLFTLVAAGTFVFCALVNGFYGYTELVLALVLFVADHLWRRKEDGTYALAKACKCESGMCRAGNMPDERTASRVWHVVEKSR